MARQKLNRFIRNAVEDQLIDQAKLNAFVAAVARHPKTSKLRWRRLYRGSYELNTPYGTLHVDAYFRGCWTATRDTAPLVHARNNEEAIIAGLPEAKATALLHAAVGFGNRAPLDDGLAWRLF
jgi:hypothetical protein